MDKILGFTEADKRFRQSHPYAGIIRTGEEGLISAALEQAPVRHPLRENKYVSSMSSPLMELYCSANLTLFVHSRNDYSTIGKSV